ncbi:hypothetical protein UZ962_01530 [Escherichia coli]|nr:hypothetical protein [Escherichia coli]MDN0645459.1 hypothetical protein [Escherichia coli]MDY9195379.1 hypothetical protein [Escherichia coli]MDY9209975.1 hypothetical protein [Escherichia coli]MDY9263067.1 hypothetical protein [Escherichia coli]
MDISPFLHTCAAVLIQAFFGYFFGRWGYGGIIGCVWFIAREQTQAEYRWIAEFGHGKRINMPWWGGFDIRVWNVGSMLDFLVPVIVCSLVYACVVYRQA